MSDKRIIDYGVQVGTMKKGPLNKISDVPGVLVGHCTVDSADHQRGVTVVLPGPENPFLYKPVAASFVLNGFGKTLGLVQIDELGTLETPIALTNTLNVGKVHDALVEYMLGRCAKDKTPVYSINPVVCECNDAGLNDIRTRVIGEREVFAAIEDARADFAEGAVGAGRGTVCHSLKGGIGSASRQFELDGQTYTIGVLVQSNHGRLEDLVVEGRPVGQQLKERLESEPVDKGSIIMIVATDLPVSDRQLKRIIKRCSVGLARLGSYIGHGSGEIMVGFTTANRIAQKEKAGIVSQKILNEGKIDLAFRAVGEATEEAVLNSLAAACTVTGWKGKKKAALRDFFPEGNL